MSNRAAVANAANAANAASAVNALSASAATAAAAAVLATSAARRAPPKIRRSIGNAMMASMFPRHGHHVRPYHDVHYVAPQRISSYHASRCLHQQRRRPVFQQQPQLGPSHGSCCTVCRTDNPLARHSDRRIHSSNAAKWWSWSLPLCTTSSPLSSWKQRSSTIPRTTTLYANVITNSNNSIIISSSSSSTTALWSPLQRRYKNTSAKNNNSGGTLANERLVARLVKLKRASHASQIRVRVVPNPLQQKQRQRLEEQQSTTASKHDKQELGETPTSQPSVDAVSAAAAPAADNDNTVNVDNTTTATTTTASTTTPTTAVVTLQEAIQQALEAQLDLVEISLDQEIPVVTIARLSALVYHGKVAASGGKRNSTGSATGKSSAKSSATSNSNSNSSNATASATANSSASQQVKEITLMVGIAEHDLRRKLANVRKFVERGHTCTVTVRASRKDLRDNAAAASDGVDRIVASLTSTTSSVPTSTSSTTVLVPLELVKAPTLNEQKTMGQFQVRASKRKS